MRADGGKRLEVADAVRELLSGRTLRQALRAREREGLRCEICKQAIRHQDDTVASLLALVSAVDTTVVFAHATCRPSQVIYIEGEKPADAAVDAVNFRWHAELRPRAPGALFMWESLTVFSDSNGDMLTDALRKLGFRTASGTLEIMSAPLSRRLGAVHHASTFTFVADGQELESFRDFALGAWTARAALVEVLGVAPGQGSDRGSVILRVLTQFVERCSAQARARAR